MTTALETKTGALINYGVTDEQIAELREKFKAMTAETPAGYKDVVSAIAETRGLRVAVEKRRTELKADALAWGRKVDAEAKRITGVLESLEAPLKQIKQAVDDEKERIRREKERAELIALEEKLRKEREEQEAVLRAEREKENTRLKEEKARLDSEKARMDEERRKLQEEQAAANSEKMRLQAEREKIDLEYFRRNEAIFAKAREEEEKARLAAIAPDIDKVHAFAETVVQAAAAGYPTNLKSPEARATVQRALDDIMAACKPLEEFHG